MVFIPEMEDKSWMLSTLMPGNIETPKIERNTKILEDLGSMIYDMITVLETFENNLKQLKESTLKRIVN